MQMKPEYPPAPSFGKPGEEPRFYYAGQMLTQAEIDTLKREVAEKAVADRQERREKWLASEEGKLCLEFYNKFQEYHAYVSKKISISWATDEARKDSPEHQLYKEGLRLAKEYEDERVEQRRQALRAAHLAARCEHRHADGTRCGSPRMRDRKLCYKHEHMGEARAAKLDLGFLEDAESIQVAIMKLQQVVIDGVLDAKQITQLSSLLRLAASNVARIQPGERIAVAESEHEMPA